MALFSDLIASAKKKLYDNEGVFQQGRFTPLQAIPQVKQANQAIVNNVVKPFATSLYNTARPIINYVDPRGYQAERTNPQLGNQKFFSAAKATVPTAINLFGAMKGGITAPVISGAISGGMNKLSGGSFQKGFQSGVAQSPTISGIGAFSNPLINKGASLVASRFTNPIVNQIAPRIASGIGNIPEGYIMNKGLGQSYSPQQAAFDFATGAALQGPQSGKLKVKGATNAKRIDPNDTREVAEIMKRSTTRYMKNGKVDLDTYAKDEKTVNRLMNYYFGTSQKELSKIPLEQKVQNLWREGMNDYRNLSMGIVDKSNFPKELQGKIFESNTGMGGIRKHTAGKVNLEDLKLMDNNLQVAKNNPSYKPTNEPIVVGVDINTGEKQLLDGYHRYLKNQGKGLMNAKFIPMKNGDIIRFDDLPQNKQQSINNLQRSGLVSGFAGNISPDRARVEQNLNPTQKDLGRAMIGSVQEDMGKTVKRDVLPWETPEFIKANPDFVKASPDEQKIFKNVQDNPKTAKFNTFDEYKRDVQETTKAVDQKVNLLDYLRTPEHVFNKIGLGDIAKQIRSAYENYRKDVKTEIDKVTAWQQQVPDPQSAVNIFRWLDGQKNAPLNPQELKVATEIEGYLKRWADKLRLPEDKRIAHYITHIFDKDFITKEFDQDLAKLIQDRIPSSVYDPFLEKRLGKMGYREDVWAALDAYVKRATRKYNMDPALQELSKAGAAEPLENWNYIKRYVDRINMRPTEIDNLLDNTIKQMVGYKYGQRPVAYLSQKIRQNVYRATLGLNVSSALKNLSQGANTYAELGEKYTFKGYKDLMTKGSDELYKTGVLNDDFIQDRKIGVYKSFLQKADKGLFFLFELAEKINRGSAYYGAKAKALDMGKSEEEAIQYALDKVRKTQFSFGAIDNPVALNSDIVKMLAQFQSYTLKQGEFLGGKISEKDYKGLIRYVGASLLFGGTVGQLIGFKFTDLIPSLRLDSPLTSSLQTIGNNFSPDEETRKQAQLDLAKNTIKLGLPAGTQTFKTGQYLYDRAQGYNSSRAGNVRFPVGNDPLTTARGVLFGSYNLPESRQYFNNKEKPLSDKQSELYRSYDSKGQKEYYDLLMEKRDIEAQKNKIKEGVKTQGMIEDPFNSDTKAKIQITSNDVILPQGQQGITKQGIFDNPLTNLFGRKKEQTVSPELALEQAKLNVEVSGKPEIAGNTALYKEGDSVKTIDFGKVLDMPTGSLAQKEKKKNEAYGLLDNVMESSLDDSQKQEIISKLGLKNEDVKYYLNAKETEDVKFALIQDKLPTYKSRSSFISDLKSWRREVNGSQFATDDILKILKDNGDISEVEYKAIKAIRYNKITGKLETAKGTGGRKFKISKITFPKTKITPIKLAKIKVRSPKIKVTKPKKYKFKIAPYRSK